jgi:hypothetical protein
MGHLEPFQIKLLTEVLIGLILFYLTYLAIKWVVISEQKKAEYEKKHVPPFVAGTDSFLRTQNGKVRRQK